MYNNNLIVTADRLENIKGIVYRKNGSLVQTPGRDLADPLDMLPHPDRSSENTPYIFTSRGCPYKCNFCSSKAFWGDTRFFSAAYVVEEIEQIIQQFPSTHQIAIWDDLFAADRQRFHTIIDILDRKHLLEKLEFSFSCRSNIVTDELCLALKKLKVSVTGFGAESGSDRVLKLMNKGSTVSLNQKALDCLHRNGIPAACSFIVGWPTETEEEVRETFEFILKNLYEGKLEAGFSVNIFMPIPGTPMWDQAIASGLIEVDNIDWKRLAAFAAFRDSNAGSLAEWINCRRSNNSYYFAEETLPQDLLYEIMAEYQMLFDSYNNLIASIRSAVLPTPEDAIDSKKCGFEAIPPGSSETTPAGYYTHARQDVAAEVPRDAISILDVGCAAGRLGARLKKDNPSRKVIGIELDAAACREAAKVLDAVYCTDIESFDTPFQRGQFDCIIFADVLEHLRDPWNVTEKFLNFLKPGGTLIASIPNIRNMGIITKLILDGEWKYRDEGILDRTHLRFFTRRQFLDFLNQLGLQCRRITSQGVDGNDFSLTENALISNNITIEKFNMDELAELFTIQHIFTCVNIPAPCPASPPETRIMFDMKPRYSFKDGICFGNDFYDENGGNLWCGPKATLYVSSNLLKQRMALGFDLSCQKLGLYRQLPLSATIYINDVPVEGLNFLADNDKKHVTLTIHPMGYNACIRIESSTFFVPSEFEDTPDCRKLSLTLSNVTIQLLP